MPGRGTKYLFYQLVNLGYLEYLSMTLGGRSNYSVKMVVCRKKSTFQA